MVRWVDKICMSRDHRVGVGEVDDSVPQDTHHFILHRRGCMNYLLGKRAYLKICWSHAKLIMPKCFIGVTRSDAKRQVQAGPSTLHGDACSSSELQHRQNRQQIKMTNIAH